MASLAFYAVVSRSCGSFDAPLAVARLSGMPLGCNKIVLAR
jgi:hypothetical protein